ncbi:MAG: SIMPL domain-containing protein [Hyphomicrobiales bacterium]
MKTLFAILAASVLMMSPAFSDDAKMPRLISVSGHGEVRALPDTASISLGVSTNAETAKAALEANSKAMTALMDSLKASGIADKNITTSNFSVNPHVDYVQTDNEQKSVIKGFDVANTVTITSTDIAGLGALLDKAVGAGSNQIYGISFTVSKADTLLDEARKTAVADARRKAEIYAAAGGFALGGVVSVSEGGGYVPPGPVMMSAKADMARAAPVAAGEQALGIDVSVTWEIK